MATVTTSLQDRAESVFREMGYRVSTTGGELRARRKWRVVRVTPMPDPDTGTVSGLSSSSDAGADLRCFVTWAEHLPVVECRLERRDPGYEWAVVGVRDDDYVVGERSL
jgi:hypothetical protein